MALFPYNDLDLIITGQTAQTATVNNILAAASGSTPVDTVTTTNSYRSFSVQIVSTGTGGSFIFEESNDGTTFQTVNVRNTTVMSGTLISAAITPTATSIIYEGAIKSRYFRVRIVTTITGGSIQAIGRLSIIPYSAITQVISQASAGNLQVTAAVASITTSVTPGTAAANLGKAEDAVAASGDTGSFQLGVRRDTPTISASATGDYNEIAVNKFGAITNQDFEKSAKTFSASMDITVAASPGDIAILPGNASNTVYVTKIIISGFASTAQSRFVQILRRSTALTGGTSSAMGVIAHQTGDTGVSIPLAFTANSSGGGALVGTVRAAWIGDGSTTVMAQPVVFEFGDKGKHLILSGVAEGIAINLNSTTVTGEHISVTFEWIEI